MSASIIYSPPRISEPDFASFLATANLPEPCSLTVEDFLASDENCRRAPVRPRPTALPTDEPGRWRDVLFEPGDVVEIRCLPPRAVADDMKPLRFILRETAHRHRLFRWPFSDEIEVAMPMLAELNQGATTCWGVRRRKERVWRDVKLVAAVPLNIYAAPNPRIAKGCSESADVFFVRSLFVDLEKMTVAEALARLALGGLPTPSMIVVSGHGVHFYWRLTEPITDLALWTACQKRLIQLLGSDPAVHDPARMMRLPGFLNVNGDPKPCYIHEADPNRRYDLADLDRHLPPLPTPPKESPPTRKVLSVAGESVPTPRPGRTSIVRRATAYADHFEPAPGGERNTKLFARTCNLVEKFGITHDEALPLGRAVNAKSEAPLDDGEVEEVVGNAVAHIDKKGVRKGTLAQQVVRVEHYEEPQGHVVPLDAWREQMRQSRIDSLKEPGIYLDASTTGAGKTTADIEAMKKAGTSLTVLPTHDACNELVLALAKQGLRAAAHPPLDETTCRLFGSKRNPGPAQTAQRAGLNVGVSVCPNCRHVKTCDYQKQRETARKADHAVVTHARASNSTFQPAEGKPVVFIHEDALNLFRPMVKVVRHSPETDTPQGCHLRQIADLALAAEDIARTYQDHGLVAFSQRLRSSATHLGDQLESDSLIGELAEADEKGLPTKHLPTVEQLAIPQQGGQGESNVAVIEDVTGWVGSPVPLAGTDLRQNAEALLHQAIEKTGVVPNGGAMKLALAYTTGELGGLCAVIDETFTSGKNNKKQYHKALIGVWKVQPPRNCVVWLENARTGAK